MTRMVQQEPRFLEFGSHRIDLEQRLLFSGPKLVPLTPKAFETLFVLVENHGRVVDKDTLLKRVWPDTFVEEGSLSRNVSILRKVLGKNAGDQTFIETIPKRGYRFVSPVTQTHDRGAAGISLPLPPVWAGTLGSMTFVGRESERRSMVEAWEGSKKGQRGVIVVCGEAGIGKTRLCAEFAHRCSEEGATVLVGRSDEQALVPYQPFIEALGWYVHACSEADLVAQLARIGGGAELAPLLPELVRRLPQLPVVAPINPDAQRYRLFETVNAWLAAMSVSRPTVVVFDDLHWADQASLLMLRHIARSSDAARLCIVGNYRESEVTRRHPLADVLADLRRQPSVTRIGLAGLTYPQVEELVDSFGGAGTPRRLVQAVGEISGGNPFFIGELLRHLIETGAFAKLRERRGEDLRPLDLEIPEGIREVIRQRLFRLSADCQRVLTLAAVVGEEFNLGLLEALAGLSEDRLLDVVDEAVGAQLISEANGGQDRCRFVHALIRETLYGDLNAARRMRLHRRVGDTLEQLERGTPNPPLADLAHHFGHAASEETADKAVDYAVRAGDRAVLSLAHEEAVRLYESALRSIDFKARGPEVDTLRVDLHKRRGRAFGALGQWGLQKGEVDLALRYLDRHQIEERAELLLTLAEAGFFLLDIPAVERATTEALELAEQVGRTDVAANAMGWLALCRQAAGDLGAAIEMDREAIARAGDDARVPITYLGLSLYLHGELKESITNARRAAELARSSNDTSQIMMGLPVLGLALGAVGRYGDAERVFEEVRQFGRKHGVVAPLARATSMAGGYRLGVFDFDGARALQAEARELALSVGFAPAVVSAGIDLLLIAARTRELSGAAELLEETVARATSVPGWHEWLWRLRLCQARAELALARGEYDTAIIEATMAVDQGHARERPKYEVLGLVARVNALCGVGRAREAIADARRAVAVARPTEDPALLLQALDVLLLVDGDDESAVEARLLLDRISDALPTDAMRQQFVASETVRHVRRA
jgi:DNA-binding winged helix-turn-helix (wHTH) protein/tetratricopeptide (TPR) repeat protein